MPFSCSCVTLLAPLDSVGDSDERACVIPLWGVLFFYFFYKNCLLQPEYPTDPSFCLLP